MTSEQTLALDVVRRYLDGYASGDVDQCMSTMSGAGPLLMIGTNLDEVFKSSDEVRQAIERDMEQMSSIRFGEFSHLHVEVSPRLASVLFQIPLSYVADDGENTTVMRFSVSLRPEDGAWKMGSCLVSVPFDAGTYSF